MSSIVRKAGRKRKRGLLCYHGGMDKKKLDSLLTEGERLWDAATGDDDPRLAAYWDELSSFVADDVPGFIAFLASDECGPEHIVGVAEVFDEIMGKTHSRELHTAFKEALKRYPEEDATYHVSEFLADAEACL